MTDTGSPESMGDCNGDARRTAPAVARNAGAIGAVLGEWLPATGLVLEIASGTGEHGAAFATQFADLEWQPSDSDPLALASIGAWRIDAPLNLRPPLTINAAASRWPIDRADAIVCINMVHISPWASALGLLDGAALLLGPGAPLILYGPWIVEGVETAPSNLEFDADLRRRDGRWGLRSLADFRRKAKVRGLIFEEIREMPANNVMLLFRRVDPAAT